MQIAGFTKLTMLDYPGRLACTVFTPGCQLRCPYCHNSQLALANPNSPTEHTISEVFSYLKKRCNVLEAVCITGGEPLMQHDIEDFILDIRKLGYLVKLDTNGGFPNRLAHLLNLNLIDYVAMDIKNCPSKYPETCGEKKLDLTPFKESVHLIQNSNIPYEFRTTIVKEFHNKESIKKLNEWGIDDSKLFFQSFKDSGSILKPGLHGYNQEEMESFKNCILPYVPNTTVRN